MSRTQGMDSPPESWPKAVANPGFAGDTGEFTSLTEDDIRGLTFVGIRPKDGGHPSVAGTMPYMLAEKHPEAPLFEGPYEERLEKILTRYPEKQAALLPALHLAQEIRGHVSPETMDEVAGRLGLAPAYVRGVATFYYGAAIIGSGALGPGEEAVVLWTGIACVLVSIVVHGVTAGPALARLLAAERVRRQPAPAPASARARR